MIHLLHNTSKPGGIEVLQPIIINHLSHLKFSVFLIRPDKPGETSVYHGMNLTIKYGSHSNIRAFFKLLKYSYTHRKDVFLAYNIGPFFLLALRVACVRHVIYAIHGTIYWRSRFQKIVRKFVWKLALSKKMKIIANSEHSKEVFKKQIGFTGDIQVVYNPIDSKRFLEKRSTKPTKKIVYAGRLSPGKNLFKWVDVAAEINKNHPEYSYVIYGHGDQEASLNDYINQKGLSHKVRLGGFRSDIERVYQEADLLLFLSRHESFGNVAVESILSGTPVIVAAIPSMREIFMNFPDFIVELDENLEKNVIKKIEQIDGLKKLVPEVKKEIIDKFSLDQHIDKLNQLFASFFAK